MKEEASIEVFLAKIPPKVTAWELRTRHRRTRYVCILSWLSDKDKEDEEEITGHGETPEKAIQAAIDKLPSEMKT